MTVALLFWFGLLLPGYVVLRLTSREDLKSGLLGTIGLSYLAVFALLSPVSILGYLLGLPLAVMSGACVLSFLAALVEITRRKWWPDIVRLLLSGLGVTVLLVAGDLVMSARAGAFMRGDSKTHVARIRYLVDHGLSNVEPYVGGDYFFTAYHTNLLHSLHASCVQLTGVDVFGEWFISLVWAKLAIVGGIYFMVWAIFDRHWAAGLAVLFFLGAQAPVTFMLYPNQVAPLWLLTIMVGFAAQACRSPCDWRTPLKLAAGSLVVAQVHGLFGLFAGIALGPFLVCLFLIRLRRREPDRAQLAACVLALFVAAPFVLVGKVRLGEQGKPTRAQIVADQRFHHFENGWSMKKPGGAARYELMALGALCAMVGPRRKQAAVLIAAAGAAAVILFTPPICTAAIKAFGPQHTVYRMGTLLTIARFGLVPAALAVLMEPAFRSRWARELGCVVIFLLGMQFAPSKGKFSLKTYYETATAGPEVRDQWLTRLRNNRKFFQEHIPPGATVLTDVGTAMWLVMAYDCHVVIHQRLRHGIPDVPQRIADLDAMLSPETSWDVRRNLLERYNIHLLLIAADKQESLEWARAHVKEHWSGSGYLLIALDLK